MKRRSGKENGSGPFAGTVPHGDSGEGPTRDAGNRETESRPGSSGDVAHEPSENPPPRPRQGGIDPAQQGRTDKPHKTSGEDGG